MVRILKSEPSTAPRIDAISPSAALPGGDVEVQGANLGGVAVAQSEASRIGGRRVAAADCDAGRSGGAGVC